MSKLQGIAEERLGIQAVAEEAGVSISTVSRVLNGKPGVGAVKREHVLSVIKRLGYQPDPAARELSFRQPTRVGFNNAYGVRRLIPFFTLYREHLFAELYRHGFRAEDIVAEPGGLPSKLTDVLVLTSLLEDDPRISYLHQRGVPFVVLGHAEGAHWVAQDNYGGGRLAAEHLLRLGHERFAFLSGEHAYRQTVKVPLLHQASQERFSGYRDALLDAGRELEDRHVLQCDYTSLGAYRAVASICRAPLRFSALFAATDELAVGAVAAFEDAGYHVPRDVSVVGFDDLPEVSEGLTTVRQDIPQLAEATVALLKEAIAGEPVRHIEVSVRLVVRGTTAKRR